MAAPILAYEGLGLIQGNGWLFRGLDIHIGARDRLALVGRNGAGKTTLLRLIANQIDSDEGNRTSVSGTNVVMLDQNPAVAGFATLMDFAIAGPAAPPAYAVSAIADQIGIDLSRDASTASGGERRRAAICRALASDPDLLLLDEPTNHLDLAAIDWLESWLSRYNKAFIVISHDRTFLTRLTQQTLWLDRGNMRRKEIGFGGYEAWQDEVFAQEARNAERIDARLKLEARWLERGVTARRKRNQGRLTKLYEMRATRAAMMGAPGAAKLGIATDDTRSKSVISADKVCIAFDGRPIITDFTLRIQRGDRIGIIGSNGAGKTTLLKLLTGEIAPDTGTITLAKTLDSIIIDQQRKLMEPQKSVRDVLAEGGDWIDVRGARKHIQGYLKEFLFDEGMVEAKISSLSGGEQTRLLLAREFARPSNLLVLDEPTNDLDLETLDLLQEVIADYDGTVLIVSHDRDFLDRTVTVTLGLDGSGKVDIIAGGYADWAARRNAEHVQQKRKKTQSADAPKSATNPDSISSHPAKKAKMTYKDQRDYEILPQHISTLEGQIAAIEIRLDDGSLYTRSPAEFEQLTRELDAKKHEKEAAEDRWLLLAEAAEA
jgi:ABC transport system ATP-binding/permease protein